MTALLVATIFILIGPAQANALATSTPGFLPTQLVIGIPTANVFGSDNRRELRDSSSPWRQVGRLYGPSVNCTATLVAKDLIVTAAHCVIDSDTRKLKRGSFEFYPGQAGDESSSSAQVTRFWWGTTNPIDRRHSDWAIGRLDDSLGNRFGWMGVKSVDLAEKLESNDIALVGYSRDFKGGNTPYRVSNCSFMSWEDELEIALHNCDATKGSSGGPMIWFEGGQKNTPWIVALNVAEYREGRERSLIGIEYSDSVANIAIPTNGFLEKLTELKLSSDDSE